MNAMNLSGVRHPSLLRRGGLRHLSLLCLGVSLLSCAPKAVPVAEKPAPTAFEQKMRWILQLEDARILRGGGGDLLALLSDGEARVRRRAALAVG